MMPCQHQNTSAALPHKHSPKGAADFGVQPCSDVGHGLTHHGRLPYRFGNIAVLKLNFLRIGQHRGVVGRKGHAQRLVIIGQGLQPCLKGGCGHIGAYFKRQQHKELLPVLGVRGNKMVGKGQQRHVLAGGNRRVIHILGCTRGFCATFKQSANICKARLAQKFGRAESGNAATAQDTRNLNSLDGIAAIAEKVAFIQH